MSHYILSTLLALTTLSLAHPKADVFHISATPEKVPSQVQFTYPGTGLDGPKVRPVNTTTFDWWYFSAISSDLANGDLSSAVVTFYDATPGGFAALSNKTTKLEVSLTGSFSDGTPFGVDAFPATAVVVTEGDGSQGRWGNYGSWSTGAGLQKWEISFQDEAQGVKGSMMLDSIAPPHLPCGIPKAGATEMLMPGIGWANAVPDATATVNFEVGGKALTFTGAGYHDKNWGAVPFFDAVSSWYWGHAHLGPYSLVWFDALDYQSNEYVSAYLAKDGEVVSSSCAKGSVTARPFGKNDEYPPPHNNKSPTGWEIVFGDLSGQDFKVFVTVADITIPYKNVYDRYIGTAEGGFENETWTGVAEFEQFKL